MDYQIWRDRILSENNLDELVAFFLRSGEDAYYLDRHVVDSVFEIPEIEGFERHHAAVAASFDLFDRWLSAMGTTSAPVVFSRAALIIDDEWINKQENAPPPHVMLTIAKKSKDAELSVLSDAAGSSIEEVPSQIRDLTKNRRYGVRRFIPQEDVQGAWLFTDTE